MMRPDTICLDVDEVLARWVDGMLALLGHDPEHVHSRWDTLTPRPWDVVEVLGVSQRDVWGAIDSRGAAFWANLQPFPWLDDLYSLCCAIAPTYLLTSPSAHPSSL